MYQIIDPQVVSLVEQLSSNAWHNRVKAIAYCTIELALSTSESEPKNPLLSGSINELVKLMSQYAALSMEQDI